MSKVPDALSKRMVPMRWQHAVKRVLHGPAWRQAWHAGCHMMNSAGNRAATWVLLRVALPAAFPRPAYRALHLLGRPPAAQQPAPWRGQAPSGSNPLIDPAAAPRATFKCHGECALCHASCWPRCQEHLEYCSAADCGRWCFCADDFLCSEGRWACA